MSHPENSPPMSDDLISRAALPTAYYECACCADNEREGSCRLADDIRMAPDGSWLCEYCYDEVAYEDGEGQDWLVWADLPKLSAALPAADMGIPTSPAPAMEAAPVAGMPERIFAYADDREWTHHKGIGRGTEYIRADLAHPQDAEPAAWLAEVHHKGQRRGAYDERIDVDEWRKAVQFSKPSGDRYRNILPLYLGPQDAESLRGEVERLTVLSKLQSEALRQIGLERNAVQAERDAALARVAKLTGAASNARMYLESGFIACPRCAEEVPTKDTDAEYELRDALAGEIAALTPQPDAGLEALVAGVNVTVLLDQCKNIADMHRANTRSFQIASALDNAVTVITALRARPVGEVE